MTEEETVCLNETQMNNIIDAARADGEGEPTQLKKVCPKALRFVRGYRPKKKKKVKEPEEVVEEFIVSRIFKKINAKLDDLF